MLQIENPGLTSRRIALFAYGFRPFFLAAGIQAIWGSGAIALFTAIGSWPATPMTPSAWHFHEMLFGFVVAAVAGFLLTAVPNWTGDSGHAGMPLTLLFGLWLGGRVAFIPGIGVIPSYAAAIDFAFLPALGVVIGRSLIRARALRNYPVLAVIALLMLANAAFHADMLGLWAGGVDFAKRLGHGTILILVALIGGRIVPAFTLNGLRRQGLALEIKPLPGIEIAAPTILVLMLVLDLVVPETVLVGMAAGLAAIVHALRLSRWHGHRSLGDPLIWVLHLGYLWLVVGLALKSAWLVAEVEFARHWIHALTAGAFATMILAVMTRASLGHTGRNLIAPSLAVVAYVLISIGAIIRVFGSLASGIDWPQSIALAGVIWGAGMLAYLIAYAPILALRRADGKPG